MIDLSNVQLNKYYNEYDRNKDWEDISKFGNWEEHSEMTLDKDICSNIVYKDSCFFKVLEEKELCHRRWYSEHETIVEFLPTGFLYRLVWSHGLTEVQEDHYAFVYDDPILYPVKACKKIVEITEYIDI